MTRTPRRTSRASSPVARRLVTPCLLSFTALLPATGRAQQVDVTVPHAPRAASSTAMAVPPAGGWGIGMDASLLWSKFSVDLSPSTTTLFRLPMQRLRIEYQLSPSLQLEIPLAVQYETRGGASFAILTSGGSFTYFPSTLSAIRPFLGAGGYFTYERASSVGESDASSETLRGLEGQLGVEYRYSEALGFRTRALYQHTFATADRRVPAENAYGLAFGTTMYLGDRPSTPAKRLPFQISIGFGLQHTRLGASVLRGSSSVTTFDLPSEFVGIYFPAAPDSRLLVGGTVDIRMLSNEGNSFRSVKLQPGIQYNINPDWRTRGGLRLGLQLDYESLRRRADVLGFDVKGGAYGVGADLSMIFPLRSAHLYRTGIGFDYLGENSKVGTPAQKIISLKFGIDTK
ncbi:MAG: hypothetical protein M3068_05380 [Gemmatimonadota bacterium]|nr:hypothetical protein [Gemmatimonadota bacterium]